MHIPDGYLSPLSSAVMYGAALPFWYTASRRLKTQLKGQMVPLLAVFSALAFTLMMFMVPVPGGSTAHPVGATLLAIVLGPWAAVIGVSVALLIQALLFGDGGIMTFGANSFNAAVILPFMGLLFYRLAVGNSTAGVRRQVLAAAVGSYLAINIMALATALELGAQPALFHDAYGAPLYFPFSWQVTVPAMLLPHLLVMGPLEAIVTGFVVNYLRRSNPQLLRRQVVTSQAAHPHSLRGLWIGLCLLILLTPLGLLATGPGLTERVIADLEKMGWNALPEGLERFSAVWRAPLSNYTILNTDIRLGYLMTACVGAGAVVLSIVLLSRLRPSRKTK